MYMHDQQCESNTNTSNLCNCGLRSHQKANYPIKTDISEVDLIYRNKIKHLESQRDALAAEVQKLKAELEHIRFLTGCSGCEIVDRLEQYDHLRSLAQGMAEAIRKLAYEERGHFYAGINWNEMVDDLVKEPLAAWKEFENAK